MRPGAVNYGAIMSIQQLEVRSPSSLAGAALLRGSLSAGCSKSITGGQFPKLTCQNYAQRHPDDGYIVFNDAPKVANLKKEFPEMYSGK